MHRRNNVHSLLIPCSSDYISSAWPSTSPQGPYFKSRAQGADNRGKAKSISSPISSRSCFCTFCSSPLAFFFPSTNMQGCIPLHKQETEPFPLRLVTPLKNYFIFPLLFDCIELQLKVGFTSLTFPILNCFLSLSFTIRTFQKF